MSISFKNIYFDNKIKKLILHPRVKNSITHKMIISLPLMYWNRHVERKMNKIYFSGFLWRLQNLTCIWRTSQKIWTLLLRSLQILCINTSYLTDSCIIFTLKMESVSKTTIFGLRMMVKSGLEKIFFKFLHVGDYFPLLHKSAQNHKFSNKHNYLSAWRDFKINFSRPLFTIIFRPKMVFLVTDSILRVKPMYESVK